MRRPARAAATLALALALALAAVWPVTAGPAAAGPGDGISVRRPDTSAFPDVKLDVRVAGPVPGLTDFHVRENGVMVPDGNLTVRPLGETSRPVGTVLVIDTSGSMRTSGALEQAKAAATTFVAGRGPNESIAVVSFSNTPVLRSDFTQDPAALLAAIGSLSAEGETALWDGLRVAAELYGRRPELQPNVVLLSDGADSASAASEQDAVTALTGAGAAVFAVGMASAEFNPAGLSSLVGATGGSVAVSSDPAGLTPEFERVRTAIENQYEVAYRSTSAGGALRIGVTAGAFSTEIQTTARAVAVAPGPTVFPSPRGLLSGPTGRYVVLFLAAAATAALAMAGMAFFGGGDADRLGRRLREYGRAEPDHPGPEEQNHPWRGAPALAGRALIRWAVDLTSKVAGRGDFLKRVEGMLDEANLPLRPAEALFFYSAGLLLAGVVAVVGAPSLLSALILLTVVAAAPPAAVRVRQARRLKAFEDQLPDTLNLLAGSLRAGYSFLQGLEAVAKETADPMARELRRVLAEARLGRPLDDALSDVATRMKSHDFEWSVLAISIQREVGGNLAELLQTVAETMQHRTRLRGEIKALTAEGRISGFIMALLPIGLGLFMFTVSPGYIHTLFSTAIGWAIVTGSVVMAIAGFLWIQKIIEIEV